jgi:hypothetical protein
VLIGFGRTSGTTPTTLPASSQVARHDTAALWPHSAPRAPPRSRTTAVGTQSHLATSLLARGITGLACCCRRLPAPTPLLLLQTATVCCLLPLLAAVTDLCAPPSPQAHGHHHVALAALSSTLWSTLEWTADARLRGGGSGVGSRR